ncbi:MAG: single-stranded DNA-binding protein [Candidatus Thermoplasmatota archaeon]|nr:single-stranded DNA-binding protein [Candidatus Thermoplasmatota archaeon]MCL6089735.1 single-stranded DNA-binding protein [Candidatus Thermoplasmatota archaeon]MDA8142991.1 single-stranded DNA-binding protein [Thermoplasmatales archaeon]
MDGTTKIKDLTPESRRVNVLAKVISKGEPKEIQTRFGEEKSVTEVYIGDETGKIILSLWGEQASQAKNGETLYIDNGYISQVRGHMRLNVGKYGSLKAGEEEITEVNEELDMSEKEYESNFRGRRPFRSGGGGSGGSGGRGGYYNNQNRGGRQSRDDY